MHYPGNPFFGETPDIVVLWHAAAHQAASLRDSVGRRPGRPLSVVMKAGLSSNGI